MIKYLQDDKLQFFWLIFHAALGFICVKTKFALIIWFFIVSASFVISLFKTKEPQFALICFLGYLLGIEVLARGVNGDPFIPHEVGKYAAFFGFFAGLSFGGPIKKISIYGFAMLLLSLPAVFIVPFATKNIVFNYLGPASLFLGVMFCSRQIITYTQFKQLCRIMIYSIFALACFTIFKASTFEKIDYNLLANFASAGGSITNQVATLYGTGICIMVLMFVTGQRLFKYQWVDISLLALFLLRGFLTFSRGGMVSAGLAVLVILAIPKAVNALKDDEIKIRKISPASVLLIIFFMVASFYIINSFTNNYLLYRYQGKTQRSLQTGFNNDADIDQISAGRYTVMLSDLNMFMAYPALGVGLGQSVILRPRYGGEVGINSHLEFSRLLAEHGALGLLIVIMMYVYPFFKMLFERNYYKRIIMAVFLIMGLSVTFHNAMRTMITPLLFAFAFLNIVPTDYDWEAGLKVRKIWSFLPKEPLDKPAI